MQSKVLKVELERYNISGMNRPIRLVLTVTKTKEKYFVIAFSNMSIKDSALANIQR